MGTGFAAYRTSKLYEVLPSALGILFRADIGADDVAVLQVQFVAWVSNHKCASRLNKPRKYSQQKRGRSKRIRPLFLYAFIPMSERRFFFVLFLRSRGASLRDSFLTLNHYVHMVDESGVCRIAVYHCQGIDRIDQ